jgi:hypothetical protein
MKRAKGDVEGKDKTTDYRWTSCPNCLDNEYGGKDARGFSGSNSRLTHVMPSCGICGGSSRLIICYTCKAVTKVTKNEYYSDSCSKCRGQLICQKHEWTIVGDIIKCDHCQKTQQLTPTKNHQHQWLVVDDNVKCKICDIKADIDK